MFKCTVIRLQNFFNRWTGSGTFQCPQHEAHVRSAWDHYRDTAFPGLTQPWSLGAGVSWTWGHLRETAAGRLTTFLTWMGGGLQHYLRQRRKGIQILKHISPLSLLPLGTHFLRTDQERYCPGSSLWIGHDHMTATADRNKESLGVSWWSSG